MGGVERLVTQNVDGLHQRAGSQDVIELHGNLRTVECIECKTCYSRQSIQRQLEAENAAVSTLSEHVGPDGDADADHELAERFRMPCCARCEGMLKPSVVFFGEGVPRERVESARASLRRSDALLVVGSSLKVYSGYRFSEWAHAMGKPIAAVNRGTTRADHLLALKIDQSCSAALCEALDA
jgi:NAD-dependent SIR2 family protein deacetylase